MANIFNGINDYKREEETELLNSVASEGILSTVHSEVQTGAGVTAAPHIANIEHRHKVNSCMLVQ